MTPRPALRALLAAAGALAVAGAGLLLAPLPASAAPTGEVTARVADPHAEKLVVTGRAKPVVGSASSVRVRLTPRVELPDSCGTFPIERSVPAPGGTYSADVTPPCNGPYRVEVVGFVKVLGSPVAFDSPAKADVGRAFPGIAPPAPRTTRSGNVVTVLWDASPSPDVVGWTVTRPGGQARQVPAATTRVEENAPPGTYTYRLQARRWGAEGPGKAEVTSPESGAATAVVPTPAPVVAPAVPGAHVPGASARPPAPPTTAARPGGGGAAPAVPSPSRRTPDAPSGSGYREDLPYAVPDEAFVPGDEPAGGTPDEAGDDETAAAGTPSARLVRSSEKVSPGLAAPLALALLMVTVAAHLGWYLRRSHRAGDAPGGMAPV